MNHRVWELLRVTKPGGRFLFLFIRKVMMRKNHTNFPNRSKKKFEIISDSSDMLDGWREVDKFYAVCYHQMFYEC